MSLDISKLPPFIPGIDLNRLFFQQIVKPLMDEHFPGLKYSAALMGEGSDVLRFDNPQSMDHNWGPHLRIFLSEYDFRTKKGEIDTMLRHKLPYDFMGFPTNFTKPVETYLVQQMKPIKSGPVNHLITFHTIRSFWEHYLGIDPHGKVTYKDWLTFPQQGLIEVTAGDVYYDGLGELEKMRAKYAYYPDEIWLYMYQIEWGYLAGLEAFMGRSGEVGDALGSSIIASDIVTYIMRLCFLMEKKYWPYPKWFGTGFSRLRCAPELAHILLNASQSKTWQEREECLGRAYEIIARMHNDLRITKPMNVVATEFEGRPYKVLHAMEFYLEIGKKLSPRFKRFKYRLGAIDQFTKHSKISHMEYVARELRSIMK